MPQTFKAVNVENDSGVSKLKSHSSHHHPSSSLAESKAVLAGAGASAMAAATNLMTTAGTIMTTVGRINCAIGALGTNVNTATCVNGAMTC